MTSRAELHDIKPLPEFSTLALDLLYGALIFLIIVAIAFLIRRFFRKEKKLALEIVVPAKDWALVELNKCESLRANQQVSVREIASSVSLVFRTYLERELGFPAAEQTVKEILRSFNGVLLLSEPSRNEIADSLKRLLVLLERLTFSAETTDCYKFDSPEVVNSIKESIRLVSWIFQEISSEKARVAQLSENSQVR